MTKPIRIAGIGCNWDEGYARLYKNKLCDVGFEVRILNRKMGYFVAYSYRSFTAEEADALLKITLGEENDD